MVAARRGVAARDRGRRGGIHHMERRRGTGWRHAHVLVRPRMTAKLWLAVVALVLLAAGGAGLAVHERAIGRQLQRNADLAEAAHVAAHAVAKAETVYVAKVDTFAIWRTRVDSVRYMVLKHLTDTVRVKAYVAATDSTIRACSDVILSCDTVRARYRALVAKDSTLAALPKPKPGLLSRVGVYAGYGIVFQPSGAVVHGVQLGVGVGVWP